MKALGGVRGDDVVSRTGSVITRMLADRTGLTSEMSDALIRPDVTHDRGAVMRDLAVAIADGASCMSEIAVLGDQSRVFGAVASTSTLWRTLNELDAKALRRQDAHSRGPKPRLTRSIKTWKEQPTGKVEPGVTADALTGP